MNKLNREKLFFLMGFIESYDYIVGIDYTWWDNKHNIKDWADHLQKQLSR